MVHIYKSRKIGSYAKIFFIIFSFFLKDNFFEDLFE